MKKLSPDNMSTQFRKSFKDFTPSLDSKVWEELEVRLLERKAAINRRKKIKILAIFVIGILLFSTIIYFLNQDTKVQITEEKNAESKSLKNAFQTTGKITSGDWIESMKMGADNGQKEKEISRQTSVQDNERKFSDSSLVYNTGTTQNNNQMGGENITSFSNSVSEKEALSRSSASKINPALMNTFNHSPLVKLPTLGLEVERNETQFTLSIPELNEGKKVFWKRWSVSPWASIDYNYRKLKKNDQSPFPGQNVEFFNKLEQADMGWSSGLNLSYDLRKNWRLQIGIAFQNHQMRISNYEMNAIYRSQQASEAIIFTSFNTNRVQFEIEDPSGIEEGDLLALSLNLRQQIHLLSIPLGVSYSMEKKRLKVSISAAMNANLFLQNGLIRAPEVQAEVKNFKQVFSEKAEKNFLGYQGALNLYYHLHPKLSIYAGPHMRGAIAPANKEKSVEFFPKTWGFRLGLDKYF